MSSKTPWTLVIILVLVIVAAVTYGLPKFHELKVKNESLQTKCDALETQLNMNTDWTEYYENGKIKKTFHKVVAKAEKKISASSDGKKASSDEVTKRGGWSLVASLGSRGSKGGQVIGELGVFRVGAGGLLENINSPVTGANQEAFEVFAHAGLGL